MILRCRTVVSSYCHSMKENHEAEGLCMGPQSGCVGLGIVDAFTNYYTSKPSANSIQHAVLYLLIFKSLFWKTIYYLKT